MSKAIKAATRESMIRTAGILQSVISSGAPPEKWDRLTRYGLRLQGHIALLLEGVKTPKPDINKAKETNG